MATSPTCRHLRARFLMTSVLVEDCRADGRHAPARLTRTRPRAERAQLCRRVGDGQVALTARPRRPASGKRPPRGAPTSLVEDVRPAAQVESGHKLGGAP